MEISWSFDWESAGDGEYTTELSCEVASIRVDGSLAAVGCAEVAQGFQRSSLDMEVDCEINGDGDKLECKEDGASEAAEYEKID